MKIIGYPNNHGEKEDGLIIDFGFWSGFFYFVPQDKIKKDAIY
jgi:hypothetical protein